MVALARTGLADLHHELAVAGELQDEAVVLVIAAEPDEVLLIDADAVLLLGPVVALPGPPQACTTLPSGSNSITGGAGTQHLARGGFGGGELLAARQAARALDDPDVVALVDRDAGDLAERPVVRQRLRPERIDLEFRHVGGHGDRRPGDQQRGGAESQREQADVLLHVMPPSRSE